MMSWQSLFLLCIIGSSAANNDLLFQSEKKETLDEKDQVFTDEVGYGACKRNPRYSCGQGLNNTCCFKIVTAAPKCCPYFEGACCADNVHCCPRGAHCDMIHKRCFRESEFGVEYFPMEKGSPALEELSEEKKMLNTIKSTLISKALRKAVMCPDGNVECADGQTCCKSTNNSYRCCQYAMAVCCSDGLHCCPKDYKCDLVNKQCVGKYDSRLGLLNWILRPPLNLP